MERKNIKKELKQYKYLQNKVEETLDEYEKYKMRAEKATSIINDMPHEGGDKNDKVADNAAMMVDINKQYQYRWIRAERQRLKIIDSINKLDEPYRTIIHMHYIKGLKFEEIASKIGYSYVRVTHLHGIALEKYKNLKT